MNAQARPRVYLAGPMNERPPSARVWDGHIGGQLAPWRARARRILERFHVDAVCPEDNTVTDHGLTIWTSTMEADFAAIRASDAVFAFITKADRDGTVAEITYAWSIGIPVVVQDTTGDLSGFVHAMCDDPARTGWPPLRHVAQGAWERLATPIEEPLRNALLRWPWDRANARCIIEWIDATGFDKDGPLPLRPLSQWPIGPYRADFLLLGRTVVECDGVTYHSDAPAVIRDKRRDRWFTERGYRVLRFSTPEITKDAAGCADQAWRTALKGAM